MKFRYFYRVRDDGPVDIEVYFVRLHKQTWHRLGDLHFGWVDEFQLFRVSVESPMNEFIKSDFKRINPLMATDAA